MRAHACESEGAWRVDRRGAEAAAASVCGKEKIARDHRVAGDQRGTAARQLSRYARFKIALAHEIHPAVLDQKIQKAGERHPESQGE